MTDPSFEQRLERRELARQARMKARRRRLIVAPILLAALVGAGALLLGGGGGPAGTPAASSQSHRVRLVARAAPFALPKPLSGLAVAASPGGPLVIGGLNSSEESVSDVLRLDRGRRFVAAGALEGPLHDAAVAVLGERVLVFGGGTETSTDAVQSLPLAAAGTARAAGSLPGPRSDLSAVSLGGSAYLLGGYDGSHLWSSVLRTEDGSSFRQVATLPRPGRYIAATALGGRIYAFGGESVEGTPHDAIQAVDPASGSARVVGRLPVALSHASAIALGGDVYVLGGETAAGPTDAIWRFDPSSGTVKRAGRLPEPVSGGGAASAGRTGYLIGGHGSGGTALSGVVELRLHAVAPPKPPPAGQRAARWTPGSPPFTGRLMIADRGNDRLLVVHADKRISWLFPSRRHPAPPGGFYFPDDAFFTHHGTQLISNEEQNERIVRLAFPSGKLIWSYGHPGVTGSEYGYLHEPDDAYLLKNGVITVADAQNCRVLMISPRKKIIQAFGSASSCGHEPPRELGSPNGDTPLRNGDMLVSEVTGSYIDEIKPSGKVVWSVQLPIEYPSDPQQLGPDRYLVADYTTPGGIYEFDRKGRILWAYHPSSGPRMLDHPSLAERLPNGLIAVNDDYRHRLVIIDPHTRRIVWQYGHTDEPGTAPGYLNTPDGFDLLAPDGTTPTHPFTG